MRVTPQLSFRNPFKWNGNYHCIHLKEKVKLRAYHHLIHINYYTSNPKDPHAFTRVPYPLCTGHIRISPPDPDCPHIESSPRDLPLPRRRYIVFGSVWRWVGWKATWKYVSVCCLYVLFHTKQHPSHTMGLVHTKATHDLGWYKSNRIRLLLPLQSGLWHNLLDDITSASWGSSRRGALMTTHHTTRPHRWRCVCCLFKEYKTK